MLPLYLALLQDSADEPLFEAFYNKYNKVVYYVAKDRLGNHEQAEDCVQEVFINLAKNFHNIKAVLNDNRIESLVRVVAKNMSIDIYRRNKRHKENTVNIDISDFFSISEEEDFVFCDQIELKEAIDSLPEEIKNIFYLKYVCGCSGSEIAGLLGISEPLVRKRCMQGRQLAKKFIEGDSNG